MLRPDTVREQPAQAEAPTWTDIPPGQWEYQPPLGDAPGELRVAAGTLHLLCLQRCQQKMTLLVARLLW